MTAPSEALVTERHGGLAVVLFSRACASLALSAYLLTHTLSWGALFREGGRYALTDGVLGLAGVIVLSRGRTQRTPLVLVALTFLDATLRIGAGITVLWLPSIAEVPMTIVPLFGAIGVCAVLLGIAALVLWVVEHHRHRHEHIRGYEALFDPIPIVALLSIAVGASVVVDPPAIATDLRQLLAVGGIVLGVSLAVASIGALRSGHFGAQDR